jgi:hypothetical protein
VKEFWAAVRKALQKSVGTPPTREELERAAGRAVGIPIQFPNYKEGDADSGDALVSLPNPITYLRADFQVEVDPDEPDD